MTLTVYHLKTCDTCRKAINALNAAGHDTTLIDVRADGVPGDVMSGFIGTLGWEAVLNRRSTTWRSLPDADKEGLDNAKALTLLAEHPTLMKRPVIKGADQLTIGWTKDVQAIWT